MADQALPPPPPNPPDITSQIQSQGEQLYQQARSRGLTRSEGLDVTSGAPQRPSGTPFDAGPAPPEPEQAKATPGKAAAAPTVKQPTAEERAASEREPGVWDFIKQAVHGSTREIGAGAAEAGAGVAHTLALAAAPLLKGAAVQAAADQAWDETTAREVEEKAGDVAFDFDKAVVQPAIEHWQPREDSGAIAQGLHNAANMVAYGAFGSAGATAFLTNSFTKQATDDIDAGKDMKTTLVDSTVTAAANAVLMKMLGKDMTGRLAAQIPTAAIRRAVSALPIGDLVNMGSDLTKKWLLEATGNHAEASKIDVTGHLTNLEEAIQNMTFGAISPHAPKEKVTAEPPPPPPAEAKTAQPAEMPPPPPPAQAEATPQQLAAKNPATATPPVHDTPTGEPVAQLRTQFVDMNRGNTPRQAVLVTPESAQHIDALGDSHPVAGPVSRLVENARQQGRVVEMPQGDLVVKTKAVATSVKSRLRAGEDPQSIIGSLTIGADGPKTPEHTVVVQGREITDGSISHEKAVRPDEVQAEMKKVVDQGKLPVVTTPEAALTERVQGIRQEQEDAAPKPGETPTTETPQGEIAAPAPSNEAAQIPPPPKAASELPAEAPKAPEPPKPTGAGGTALQQLGQALEAHEKQEAVPEGKKKSAPVAERLQNAADFARVLKQAAVEAGTKKSAPDEVVTRAAEAASKAERFSEKTPDEIAKSRGTSRVLITARVNEMHKAARQLMGKAKPGDEVTEKPHEAIQKQRQTKKATKAAEPAKPAAPEKAKPVAADKPSAQEQAKASRLLSRAIAEEEPERARIARDALEQHIHDVAARLGTPDNVRAEQVREVMHFLEEQRKKRPAEEGEEETPDLSQGYQTGLYRPSVGGKASEMVWHRVTNAMREDFNKLGEKMRPALAQLKAAQDTGKNASFHQLLDLMVKHSEGPYMTQLTTALRRMAPDVPVFPREVLIDPRTAALSEHSQGLFIAAVEGGRPMPMIQLRMNGGVGDIMRTLIHEGFHSASEYELAQRPDGPYARELERSLEILRNRMRSMHGTDVIDQHIAYWGESSRGRAAGVVPEGGVKRHLYGLTNPSEMVAEMLSNPQFMQEIIDSEAFASPKEDLPAYKGLPGLLMKIFSAMARMLGVNEPKLLAHLMDITTQTIGVQRLHPRLAEMYDTGFAGRRQIPPEALKNMGLATAQLRASVEEREVMSEPAPLKGSAVIRAAVGDEGTETVRDSVHSMRSRGVDMARNALFALKTVGQIMRDARESFGHDDETNPINQLKAVLGEKNKVIQSLKAITNPVAKAWMRLGNEDNRKVGQLMIDSTMYKIDPREDAANQSATSKAASGFAARHAEYRARYDALSPEARAVYDMATDANRRLRIEERRIAVDTTLEAHDITATPEELAKLRGVRAADDYDRLIGTGREIDFGDKNDKVKSILKEWAGATQLEGPYHHLGRQGSYVVQANPEGTREFGRDKEKAEAWAQTASDMSPNAKATVEERGGQWVVDYKVQHVSFHKSRREGEKAQKVLEQAGFEPGAVTVKSFDQGQSAMSHGMQELITEADRKISKGGNDEGAQALREALVSAFMQVKAQKSAYAGSQLMRKNVSGVKASEMRQNFAEHASSSVWHAAQMRTLFKQAAANARLREMTRDRDADQATAYVRGDAVKTLNAHALDEARNWGTKNVFNRYMARLGFLNYLTSPAHAAIWLTQNMTTGIPWAGARYGYGKATAAFMRGMGAVSGPALRKTMNGVFMRGGDSEAVHAAIVEAIKGHPTMGKWADAIKQLGDRGVISHGYANELGELAGGGNPKAIRAMEWARLLPHMADAINRVSTALAGLELTGGDLRKTADMIETIHADYSQQNKPLAFKRVNRIWGLNSLTMMKTYAQEMAHLTYSNLIASVRGETKAARWEAAKTVAGLAVGNALFAGVYGAVGLEPLRFLMYAYHKAFDDEGEVWDFKNAVHHFLVDHFGSGVGNVLARGPVAAALGVDVSERMGLANLILHDPPDIWSSDKDMWKTFVMDQAGPAVQLIANTITGVMGHLQNGEVGQAVASAVPIKMFQDGVKALQLMETGKLSGAGAQLTEPSTLDAAKQLFGLKPASVADAQERQGVMAEYHRTQATTRDNLVKQYLTKPEDRAETMERIRAFNARNPGAEVRMQDIIKAARRNQAAEENLPSKNQRANEAADFTSTQP